MNRKTTTYNQPPHKVTEVVDGIPVDLVLHERSSDRVETTWWTLSWRTRYSPNGNNRQYYQTKQDGSWTIPAATALDMIRRMEKRGGLDERYFDHRCKQVVPAVVSTDMTPAKRAEAWTRMTAPGEDWGPNPFFVIVSDATDLWKKVMIINTMDNLATFRSITEDPGYGRKKVLRPGEGWWLDNAMMDANVQQMRQFYKSLREYFVSQSGLKEILSRNRSNHVQGGGEGPIHESLKAFIAANPEFALSEPGLRTIEVEYPFPTGDRVDIILEDKDGCPVTVEVEVDCDENELAGPLQCMKYRSLIEYLCHRSISEVRTVLAARSIAKAVQNKCKAYGIEIIEIPTWAEPKVKRKKN